MPDNSSNMPFSTIYSIIGAELFRVALAGNNPTSFSTVIKPLVTRVSREGISIEKINSIVLKFLTKFKEILILFAKANTNC